MQIIQHKIDCRNLYKNSKRTNPFELVKYVFNYQLDNADKLLLDSLIEKGKRLALKVNQGAANNSSSKRNSTRVLNNCIAGVLAEYVWKHYLNSEGEIVSETAFENINNQIDLIILENSKTIEVRSSFPKNGVEFAICHASYEFDIIGPYNNTYKPNEIQKDFYTRTLFAFDSNLIQTKILQDGLEVFLTGGATWNMMSNNNIAIVKDFIPDGEINPDRLNSRSNYRVVPFSKALDTNQIVQYIKLSVPVTELIKKIQKFLEKNNKTGGFKIIIENVLKQKLNELKLIENTPEINAINEIDSQVKQIIEEDIDFKLEKELILTIKKIQENVQLVTDFSFSKDFRNYYSSQSIEMMSALHQRNGEYGNINLLLSANELIINNIKINTIHYYKLIIKHIEDLEDQSNHLIALCLQLKTFSNELYSKFLLDIGDQFETKLQYNQFAKYSNLWQELLGLNINEADYKMKVLDIIESKLKVIDSELKAEVEIAWKADFITPILKFLGIDYFYK